MNTQEINMTPAPGWMIVKLLPGDETIKGDYEYERAEVSKNSYAIVEKLGPPSRFLYGVWDMMKWKLFGIHPCPFSVGDKVLLDKYRGITPDDGSSEPVHAIMEQLSVKAYVKK
jgi:hypothetical protein